MTDEPQVPRLLDVFAQKAGYYAEAGRHDRAEAELRKGLALAPDDGELHYRLSLALMYQDRAEEAEQEAREVLRLEPQLPLAHLHLAMLLKDRGQHVEAEQRLIEALRLAPDFAAGYLVYGILMMKTKRLEKAEKLLRRCLAIDPGFPGAHAYLGAVLADARKGREAAVVGALGVGLDPEDVTSHALLGRSLYLAGRPFAARRVLRDAVRLDPGTDVVVELHHDVDRACRWIYLPFYYWTLATSRLPGQQFLVWGVFIVLLYVMRFAGVPRDVTGMITIGWLLFAVYTWVATPLANLWIRMRPAR